MLVLAVADLQLVVPGAVANSSGASSWQSLVPRALLLMLVVTDFRLVVLDLDLVVTTHEPPPPSASADGLMPRGRAFAARVDDNRMYRPVPTVLPLLPQTVQYLAGSLSRYHYIVPVLAWMYLRPPSGILYSSYLST